MIRELGLRNYVGTNYETKGKRLILIVIGRRKGMLKTNLKKYTGKGGKIKAF